MKRALSIILILFALSTSALAADQSTTYAPIAPIPFPNWNGIYVGFNGGGGDANAHWQYQPVPAGATTGLTDLFGSGGVVGGTIGFNWEFFPYGIVAGVEGDWDWATITSRATCAVTTFECKSEINSLGTLRGRIGWNWDRLLIYGSGGFAWGDLNSRTIQLAGLAEPPSGTPINGTTGTQTGWAAGLGLEYAFWNFLTFKFEWIHYDLGPESIHVDNPALYTVSARENGDLIRAGFNYKFDLLGTPLAPPAEPPLVTRY